MKENKKEKSSLSFLVAALMASLVAIGAAFVIATYQILAWGFVFVKLWAWFVVPVFPTLPLLSYGAAIGLYIFKTALAFKIGDLRINMENEESKSMRLWAILTGPWLTLLLGWLFY